MARAGSPCDGQLATSRARPQGDRSAAVVHRSLRAAATGHADAASSRDGHPNISPDGSRLRSPWPPRSTPAPVKRLRAGDLEAPPAGCADVPAQPVDLRARCAAFALALPADAAFSHLTAARLLDLPTPAPWPGPEELLDVMRDRSRNPVIRSGCRVTVDWRAGPSSCGAACGSPPRSTRGATSRGRGRDPTCSLLRTSCFVGPTSTPDELVGAAEARRGRRHAADLLPRPSGPRRAPHPRARAERATRSSRGACPSRSSTSPCSTPTASGSRRATSYGAVHESSASTTATSTAPTGAGGSWSASAVQRSRTRATSTSR